jgi:hypothetical protein
MLVEKDSAARSAGTAVKKTKPKAAKSGTPTKRAAKVYVEVEGDFKPAPPPNWDITLRQPEEAFVAYAPGAVFVKGTFLEHTKFGRGVVAEADRTSLRVVFQDGMKKLAQPQ